jgi:hypothetical protein
MATKLLALSVFFGLLACSNEPALELLSERAYSAVK